MHFGQLTLSSEKPYFFNNKLTFYQYFLCCNFSFIWHMLSQFAFVLDNMIVGPRYVSLHAILKVTILLADTMQQNTTKKLTTD